MARPSPSVLSLVAPFVIAVTNAASFGQSCAFSEGPVESCGFPRVIPGTPGQHVVYMDTTDSALATTLCGLPTTNVVWFEVVPTVNGPLTFSTCHPLTSYDTIVAAYSGGNSECQGMLDVDCNDDDPADGCDNGCSYRASTITIPNATAATRYRFAVGEYSGNATNCTNCLGVVVTVGTPCGDPPTNFLCELAQVLPGEPGTHSAEIDVTDAPDNLEALSCPDAITMGHSVWFTFTPTVNGRAVFSTCDVNTAYDTVARVFGGCGGLVAQIACNDDTVGCSNACGTNLGSRFDFEVTAGLPYYLEVGSFGNRSDCNMCLGVDLTINECTLDSDCDDADPCTTDECDAGICYHNLLPPLTPCPDDGNECTADYCWHGGCTHPTAADGTPCGKHSATDCDAPDECVGGTCQVNYVQAGVSCSDDGIACTSDVCDGSGACTHPDAPDDTPCGNSDDTVCDNPDSCLDGICVANHAPAGTPCDDSSFCNGGELCNEAGICVAGTAPCGPNEVCDEEGDRCDADCNENGVDDGHDIADGTSEDCNANGLPDECEPGLFCFEIDPTVTPMIESLPGIGGAAPRRVAAVRAPDGSQDEFIVDEVVLRTTDPAVVEQIVSEYNAVVLRNGILPLPPPMIPSEIVRPEFANTGQYLLKVDLSTVDLAAFDPWLQASGLDGTFLFSTDDAVRLSALLAKEQLSTGLDITPNPIVVTPSTDCVLTETSEYLSTSSGTHVNGFNFGWLKDEKLLVTRSWQYFDLLGIAPATVYLAMVDTGFAFNADFPSPSSTPQYDFVSETKNVDGVGNNSPCSGSGPISDGCRWHGVGAYSVAAAIMDNDFGSAGTSGRAGVPILINHDGTLEGVMEADWLASYWGADVINTNGAVHCNWWCDVFGPEGWVKYTVAQIAGAGAVPLYPAGNEGTDLGGRYMLPCEVAHALCVGGIDLASKHRAGGSNYGSNVDMWAPYGDYVITPTPATDPDVTGYGGTCPASAFVAGVITHMLAINPSMSPTTVLDVLHQTANVSPDPQVNHGYINAYAAVKQAATTAGLSPVGDSYEPNDTDAAARAITPGTYTATVAPGDADYFTFTTDDYVDFQLSVSAKERITPGNGLYIELDSELPKGFQANAANLSHALLKPGRHVVSIWGQTSNAINCYTFTWSMTPSTIAPDRFDDRTPASEPRNDTLVNVATISDTVDANITLMTAKEDKLNHDVVGDIDFFTARLGGATGPGGEPECCTEVGPDTIQGRFRLLLLPDTVRPFEIKVYRPDGSVLDTVSGLSYTLECPHSVFPGGEIRFSVKDKTSRNFYDLGLGFNRCDVRIYPNWFLEADPPLFNWIVPEFMSRIALIYPLNPVVQDNYFRGLAKEPFAPEYLPFVWSQLGNFALNIELPGYCAGAGCLDIHLVNFEGQTVAAAFWASAPGGPGMKRLEVSELPPGTYFLRIEGGGFGRKYLLSSVVIGDQDFDQDVDLFDAAAMQRCFGATVSGELLDACSIIDLNGSGTVDLGDVPPFTQSMLGP